MAIVCEITACLSHVYRGVWWFHCRRHEGIAPAFAAEIFTGADETLLLSRSLTNIRLNNRRVSDGIMAKILGFFFINICIFVLVTLLICIIEPGLGTLVGNAQHKVVYSSEALQTASTSVIATLYNIGPGLADVGPTMNYAWMAPQTKMILIFTMLVGRLEVYTVLVLFLPIFWRK